MDLKVLSDLRMYCKSNDQVVNSSDPSWWQARHEEGDTIGLIPSQDLEERRKCFVEKPDMSSFTKWSSCCGGGVSVLLC